MALWRIQRIFVPPPGTPGISCEDPGVRADIEMLDTTTGHTQVATVCLDRTGSDPCLLMRTLRDAGYTPAEWDGECPP